MKRSRRLCVVLLVVSIRAAYGQVHSEEDPLALIDASLAEEVFEMRRLGEGSGLGQNGTNQAPSTAPSSMTSSEEDSKDNSTDADTLEPEGEPTDLYDPTPTREPTPSSETVQFPPAPTSTVPTPEPQVAPASGTPSMAGTAQDNMVPYSIAGGTIILVIALAIFALIFRRNRESIHKQEGNRTVAMSEMFLSSRSRQDSQSESIMEVEEPSEAIADSRRSHEVRGSSDIYQDSDLSSPGPRFSFESDSYRYSGATSGGNSVPVLFDDPPSSRSSSFSHAPIYDTDSDFGDL